MSNIRKLDDLSQGWQDVVRQHVESLRYGTVEIIVHDSRVIQIEKTERLRFDKAGGAQAHGAAGKES